MRRKSVEDGGLHVRGAGLVAEGGAHDPYVPAGLWKCQGERGQDQHGSVGGGSVGTGEGDGGQPAGPQRQHQDQGDRHHECAQNIGVGLLRGLDDSKGCFRVTLVGYWLVGLPAAALLGLAIGLDTLGLWLGLLTGLATTAVLLLRRFNRGLGRLPLATEPAPSQA